jgi:hypothetical protein
MVLVILAIVLPPLALQDLQQLFCTGASLMLVTRDERMAPEITRAAAARLGEDGLVRVALPLPESRRTLWNLEVSSLVALSAVLPTTYRTLQVKGTDARPLDWPGHEDIARAHMAAFTAEVIAVGVAHELAGGFCSHNRYATIAFTPSEIYEQTPGPTSGLPLST